MFSHLFLIDPINQKDYQEPDITICFHQKVIVIIFVTSLSDLDWITSYSLESLYILVLILRSADTNRMKIWRTDLLSARDDIVSEFGLGGSTKIVDLFLKC